MKKIFLNKEVIGENLDLMNADSCFIFLTQDQRTVALNEVAAFILEHCNNHSEQEMITMLKDTCDVCSLTDGFEDEIKEFIDELEKQKLIIVR